MRNILFLHPNYPGQFPLLARELAASGDWKVVAIGDGDRQGNMPPGISYHHYTALSGAPDVMFPPVVTLSDHVRRGRSAADVMLSLRAHGFSPDIVVAHPGWGDALFVPDVFPHAKYVAFLEYFYHAQNSDIDFDAEFRTTSALDLRNVRLRNLTNLQAFADAAQSITPTQWQASLFPEHIRGHLEVLHEGIDTDAVRPHAGAQFTLADGRVLTRADEVVTYVARSLEPYRGFHVFMRALPALLRARPAAQVVIVGGDGVSYGRTPPGGGSWKECLLREVGASLDLSRVHFMGRVAYGAYRRLLTVSTVHVYLTYPFVLSWSYLEAMASGCALVGSASAPVLEVLDDGVNGRAVDFFDRGMLVDTIIDLLETPAARERLGQAARDAVVSRYDFRTQSLPRYIELFHRLLAR